MFKLPVPKEVQNSVSKTVILMRNWAKAFFGEHLDCGHHYPDNRFIVCERRIYHLGKCCSHGGVKWKNL